MSNFITWDDLAAARRSVEEHLNSQDVKVREGQAVFIYGGNTYVFEIDSCKIISDGNNRGYGFKLEGREKTQHHIEIDLAKHDYEEQKSKEHKEVVYEF